MRKFLLALVLVLLAGLIQNTGLFSIFGIRPNLLLAAVVAAAFFMESLSSYLGIVLPAVILLRFESGFQLELLVFAVLALAAFGVRQFLPWRPSATNFFLGAVFIIILYLIADPAYLFGSIPAVIGEIVYTSFFGLIFYDIFRNLGDNEDNIFKR